MNAYPEKQQYTADDLAAIIAILRNPDCGCPWDKVQTHTSIRMNFLEEAYEAVDAIDLNDPELLCEELGDVMMQVVFHAQIEREAGHFTFDEVCDGVCRKLIERHPHIFGGDESIKDWDSLKNKEKGRLTLADDLESVPKALPALMRAAKLQKRAARYGVQTESAADTVAAAAAAVETAPDKARAEQAHKTRLSRFRTSIPMHIHYFFFFGYYSISNRISQYTMWIPTAQRADFSYGTGGSSAQARCFAFLCSPDVIK